MRAPPCSASARRLFLTWPCHCPAPAWPLLRRALRHRPDRIQVKSAPRFEPRVEPRVECKVAQNRGGCVARAGAKCRKKPLSAKVPDRQTAPWQLPAGLPLACGWPPVCSSGPCSGSPCFQGRVAGARAGRGAQHKRAEQGRARPWAGTCAGSWARRRGMRRGRWRARRWAGTGGLAQREQGHTQRERGRSAVGSRDTPRRVSTSRGAFGGRRAPCLPSTLPSRLPWSPAAFRPAPVRRAAWNSSTGLGWPSSRRGVCCRPSRKLQPEMPGPGGIAAGLVASREPGLVARIFARLRSPRPARPPLLGHHLWPALSPLPGRSAAAPCMRTLDAVRLFQSPLPPLPPSLPTLLSELARQEKRRTPPAPPGGKVRARGCGTPHPAPACASIPVLRTVKTA